MKIEKNKIYTLTQVAKILSLHVDTVREKVREGELRAKNVSVKSRPNYRIPGKWILEYLEN